MYPFVFNNVLIVISILTPTQPRYPTQNTLCFILRIWPIRGECYQIWPIRGRCTWHYASQLITDFHHHRHPQPSHQISPWLDNMTSLRQCPHSLLTSHPGVHLQAPSTGLQLPLCWHWHVLVQLVPCRPSGHTESHLWWGRCLNFFRNRWIFFIDMTFVCSLNV